MQFVLTLPDMVGTRPRKLPEGHARGSTREREILLNDSSPQVLEALARNPKLLPRDVVTLLRIPNILPTTLEILGRDPRLAQQEEVRILIASHPKASLPLARKIAADLSPEGQAKLLRRPSVHPTVRADVTRGTKGRRR